MSKVYKFLFLGVLMTLATAAFGQQVVFNENLGDVGQHKEANALLSPYADWENSAPVTFDHGGGGVFIDVATPSTGYTGASGNGYLVLQSPVATAPENVYHSLQIDGISTADLDSISLSFGFYSAAAADDDGENLEVYVSDGGAWTQLSTESTFPTFQTWGLVTFGANVIPATGTLSLKFVHNGTADVAFFIDDISLSRPTSMDASIWSFSLGDVDRAPAYMDSAAIDAEVVNGTALDNLVPVIKIHPDASITPAGAQDFSGGPVTYTVTAEDGSTAVDYVVTIEEGPAPHTAEYDIAFADADSNFVTYTTSGEMDDDFEAYYKSIWTDTALHVFVHVEDPDLVNSNEGFDQNDYIDIFVDMDRAFPYVENQDNGSWWNTYDKNDAQIGFHRDNETLIELGGQYSGRLITADAVSFTVSEVDGGNAWELVAVIEFAGLDPDLDAFEGREMGLDVVVGDADVVGEERNGRAAWYGRADNPWQHPRQWGKLVLGTGMQNDNTDILAFSIADQRMDAEIDTADQEISVEFPLGTDVTALMPEIVVHEKSSVSPASGVATDFTDPQTYTVTAQDASTQDWTVTVTFGPAPDTAMYEEAFADADSNFVTYTTSGEMDDDFEAYYKVSYDDTALHVFVHVEDPDLVNSNEGFDQNDYIDIFLDMDRAFPYVENSDNGSWWNTYDKNDAQIGFIRDNDTLKQLGGQYSGRIVTADAVSFMVSEVDGGNAWELEASILFEGMDPDLDIYDMRTLGLEVVVGDADVVGEERNGRAAWFGPADNAWQHPRQWGPLVLEGGPENDNTDILAFSIEGQRVNAAINGTDHEIGVDLPYGTDVTALEPAIEVHEASTVSPANGAATDFTNPVTYTVTAQDGSTQDWIASVTLGLEPDTSTYEDTFANADSNFVTYTTSGEMDDDFEAYYKTFWADTALHVFVHVEDPDLVNSNEGFDQNDYIDIFLDMDSAFPYVENSDNGSWWNTYDKNDAQIGFHRDNDTLINIGGQYSGRIVTTDAVSYTVAEVDGGNAWELEAVISFAGMDPDEIVGNELELGFELVVGDADVDTIGREGRAAWYGPADNAWQHPRQWGTLVLEGQAASSDALIHKAMLDEMNSDTAVVIDAAKDTVIITVEFGTDVTALEPMLKLHPAASVDLTGPQDFTNPVAYTVTAEDASTRVWDIAVDIETANSANLITAFSVPDQRSSTIDDDAGTVESVVEFMADVSALEATVEVSPDASVTPASGLVRDFTVPVVYTVIAEDESNKDYVVTMKRAPGLVDSRIGTFNSEAGRIEDIWTDSTTVTELLDSLVLSDNAESAAVLLIADSTAVAGTEILTSAMFLRISGGGLDTDYGLVVTDAPAPPIPVTGFVENFDDPATVDMTMWDVNPRKHNDDPSGDPVFVVTHDVAEGALKIVMDQFEFPDGLMFNLSKYIIDLTNNPLAQMTIKIQDATYAGVTTLSIPVQLSAFSFWGEAGRRLGGENVPVTLDDNGSIDFTTLYYDFRVGGSWATDSAGIDSTQYILFETVAWPSPHTATIWIDEIRLGDSAAPYVPSSEAEILATMYGTINDANKVVEGVSDSLTVTEFLIGLTISDMASVLMLDGPAGDTITKPERTDIADTQVIQVTAEDGTIQEYTITVWSVSVGNLIAPDVVIYPNPARDILYIRNLDGFDRLSVTNIVGKHVRMINIETKQLDINVSDLENGLYFLNLYSSKYGTVTTKFIKR